MTKKKEKTSTAPEPVNEKPSKELLAYAKQMSGFDISAYIQGVFAKKAIGAYISEKERVWEKIAYYLLKTHVASEVWDDRKAQVNPAMYIRASSWTPKRLFPTPILRTDNGAALNLAANREFFELCPPVPGKESRLFAYANQELATGRSVSVVDVCNNRGRLFFDGPVVTPVLFEFTADGDVEVWMGMTPMEIFTQRVGVAMATGRVVVGGLGLGWFLNAVCEKKDVTEVILVEREENLLHWMRPAIEAAYPAVVAKTEWVNADVYKYMERDYRNRDRTKYLLDIWPDFGGCLHDKRFVDWGNVISPEDLWGWGQTYEPNTGA